MTASCGRMKWARLSGLMSSEGDTEGWVGRNPLMRLRMPVWAGGGRLRMDLPGTGIVTADEDGELHDDELAITMTIWISVIRLVERFLSSLPSTY